MATKPRTVRHSTAELEQIRHTSLSDWAASSAMTEEEIEAAIASDPDEAGMVLDWSQATATQPGTRGKEK